MNKYGVLAIDLAKTVFQVCKTEQIVLEMLFTIKLLIVKD